MTAWRQERPSSTQSTIVGYQGWSGPHGGRGGHGPPRVGLPNRLVRPGFLLPGGRIANTATIHPSQILDIARYGVTVPIPVVRLRERERAD